MPQENLDTMEYVYAALLLHKLGKNVDEANLSSVVKASGAEVNEAQVKSLVAALADINIDDAVKAAPVAVAVADAPAAGGEAKEEKKEERHQTLKRVIQERGNQWREDCCLYTFVLNRTTFIYELGAGPPWTPKANKHYKIQQHAN